MIQKAKSCIRCGLLKLLSEFYPHPKMADGYLGKCKTCCKSDTAKRLELKALDPEWVKQERARHRAKSAEARRLGTHQIDPTASVRWSKRNQEKRKAQHAANNALRDGKLVRPNRCGKCRRKCKPEMHHPDYSKPLEVEWVCTECHGETRRK